MVLLTSGAYELYEYDINNFKAINMSSAGTAEKLGPMRRSAHIYGPDWAPVHIDD